MVTTMAVPAKLIRHWYPTNNYSSGGNKRFFCLHTTEGWGDSPTGMYDCIRYFQGNVGASSHVAIDAFHPGEICEGVAPQYSAWTQCNYNSQCAAAAEQCGYAAWSRSEWLNNRMPLLENAAAWLREENQRRPDIPLVDLTSSQAQGSGKGVCFHSDLGSAGCGHHDPGSGYPLAEVLEMARSGSAPPPETIIVPEGEEVPDMYMLDPGKTNPHPFGKKGKYEKVDILSAGGAFEVRIGWLSDGGWSWSNWRYNDSVTHAITAPHYETTYAMTIIHVSGAPVGYRLREYGG